jgi:phosphatidylserine/phosphatidylglycerophosphate/cardiolipin synthase-like enzyme
VACGIAARLSIDAALRAALVLLICGTVVWYRVMANISTVLNFDKCVEFMDLLDQAAALLNQPGQDALWWLRRSANDLSALAASAVSNALDTKQLDEAKRQIELFVTLGLVTGQTLNKFKQQLAAALQAAQSAPVSA